MRATAEGYLLFCTEVGKPLDRRNVMRRFTQIPRAWSSPGAPCAPLVTRLRRSSSPRACT